MYAMVGGIKSAPTVEAEKTNVAGATELDWFILVLVMLESGLIALIVQVTAMSFVSCAIMTVIFLAKIAEGKAGIIAPDAMGRV